MLMESPRKTTAKLLTTVKVAGNKAEIRKIYFDYDSPYVISENFVSWNLIGFKHIVCVFRACVWVSIALSVFMLRCRKGGYKLRVEDRVKFSRAAL